MPVYHKATPDKRPNGRPTRLVRSGGTLLELNDTWYLDDLITNSGEVLFGDELQCCRTFPSEPLTVTLKHDGTPLDFSFTLAHVPVVNSRVANILSEMAGADVQLIPAQVKGHSGEYAVVNVLRSEDCIIEDRSMYSEEYWIDGARAKNAMVLRPRGLHVVLLIAEEVRDALVRAKVAGVKFRQVSE
jgi:hypothetical protein